jgi:hypothetical protein
MTIRRLSTLLLSAAILLPLAGRAQSAPPEAPPKTEIHGAAILDHPCGKLAVKHMGLVHAGKIDEAAKLGTPEMQKQWKALPADKRSMMTEIMQGMSYTEAQFSDQIKNGGVLVVDGKHATLTVQQQHLDANGSSTEKMTQNYLLDGDTCRITR